MFKFGGSDIGNLMGKGNYACVRKAYYRAMGVKQDYESDIGILARGNDVESIIMKRFLDKPAFHNFQTVANWFHDIGKYGWVAENNNFPFLKCHLDDVIIEGDDLKKENAIMIELKAIGKWMWEKYTEKGELAHEHLLQCQANMAAGDYQKAILVMMYADGDRWGLIEFFEIERNEKIIKAIHNATVAAQDWVNDPPEREITDLCNGCFYRQTCLGEYAEEVSSSNGAVESEEDERLAEMISLYESAKYVKKTADIDLKKLKPKILKAMGARPIITTSEGNAKQMIITATRLDSKRLKAEKPEVWNEYAIKGLSVKLTTSENMGK